MSLWRPYEESDEDEHYQVEETNFRASLKKQKGLRVGEKEKEIIINSYLRNGDQWINVLQDIKSRVEQIPMVNAELVQFYLKEDMHSDKVLRRIKRIVSEESKMQALLYQKTQHNQPSQYGQQVENSLALQDHQKNRKK